MTDLRPHAADLGDERREVLNQADAANFLGVDEETLRRWERRGVGPRRSKFGRRFVRYRRADLEAWLDQHATQEDGEA